MNQNIDALVFKETTHNGGTHTSAVAIDEYEEDKFSLTFVEKFSGAKNPDEWRKTGQHFLSRDELWKLGDYIKFSAEA